MTTVPRTLLDLASLLPRSTLRRAIAEVEFRRLADLEEVEGALRRGHPGSAALRAALAEHRPELAHTLSALEERFLALCEANGIPLPEVNPKIGGMMIDAVWHEQRVAVELDGHAAHRTDAAIERDRRRELRLRALGYRVLRYTWQQVTRSANEVAADLRAALAEATSRPAAGSPHEASGRPAAGSPPDAAAARSRR